MAGDDDVIIIRRARIVARMWGDHGTKILGMAQVTAATLAAADPKMIEATIGLQWMPWIHLGLALLTVWRGFVNTAQAAKS
jgi:hypothetical protein